MLLIITTAPNKPKVGVSEGIQNKHCAPQRRLAYSKKQSQKKTSWRQPAEQKDPGHLCCFLWTHDNSADAFLLYLVVLNVSTYVSVLSEGPWFLRISLDLTRLFILILLGVSLFTHNELLQWLQ